MEIITKNVTVIIKQTSGKNEWNESIEDRVDGLTKKAYGWSKYGGANLGLVQENKTADWSCQACGTKQASELPSYMFEVCPNEFIRICSICQAQKLLNHIGTLQELIKHVRLQREPWEVD